MESSNAGRLDGNDGLIGGMEVCERRWELGMVDSVDALCEYRRR